MSDMETPIESAANYSLPKGHFTLLPLVESCDNFVLPAGPWTVRDCKARRVRYQEEAIERKLKDLKVDTNGNGRHGSAVDDEDDEVDDVDPRKKPIETATALPAKAELDNEFLVPFFLDLPHDSNLTGSTSLPSRVRSPSINGLSRRSSSSSLTRPAFKLTPLPSLRPSSPSSATPALPTLAHDDTPTTKAQPIGFLRPSIVMALMEDNVRMVEMSCKPVWAFLPPQIIPPSKSAASRRPSGNWTSRPSSRRNSHALSSPATTGTATPEVGEEHHANGNGHGHGDMDRNRMIDVLEGMEAGGNGSGVWAVGFEDHVNDEGVQSRREHLDRVVRGWKMSGMFPDQLGGWRNESYNIYGPPAPLAPESNPLPGSNVAFTLERAACSLFGLCTFGVHLTAYVEDEGQPMKIWVPKRSATKQTWPSYLDNTVAGGITAGDSPFDSIIRECEEEASLPASYVVDNILSTSVIIYTTRTAHGWISPEVQYIYDLPLPTSSELIPRTNASDGEVESFELLTIGESVERALKGEFKPNCAMVLVDFLIRKGYVTPERDVRFLELASRLRREIGLPGPA